MFSKKFPAFLVSLFRKSSRTCEYILCEASHKIYLHLTEEVFSDITEKISIDTEDNIPNIGDLINEE